ncbi:hypothetical protein CRYUN_Cryun39dG0047100 [Craigia yunnanensis]
MNLFKGKWENLGFVVGSKADLIIPFSRDLPLNDRLCYEIENATDVKVKEFKIPQNAYRVVLEVYVSFYENDEFWYGNPPNEHITANNPTDLAGNGPFREVVISLDGEVGIYWMKTHKLSFGDTNALNVWYIDANLHLWLDSKSTKTEGKLLQQDIVPPNVSSMSNFKGLNGTFATNTTKFIVNHTVHFDDRVYVKMPTLNVKSNKSLKRFLLYLYFDYLDQGNETSLSVTNVILGFNDKKFKDIDAKSPRSSLKNLQK